jgi:hypothetical protein
MYYEFVDELPLFNWIKINEGKIEYSRKDINNGNEKDDLAFVYKIKDDNYREFGVAAEHLRLLELQLELAEVNLEFVITGDNFLKNKIAHLNYEIKELLSDDKKGDTDVYDTIITLSKWMGSRVDPKAITVKEFRKMITALKKEVALSKKK